jgi:hypothetical protein
MTHVIGDVQGWSATPRRMLIATMTTPTANHNLKRSPDVGFFGPPLRAGARRGAGRAGF